MSKGDAFDFAAKILQTGEGTDREKFLARAVGLSSITVSRYETGERDSVFCAAS